MAGLLGLLGGYLVGAMTASAVGAFGAPVGVQSCDGHTDAAMSVDGTMRGFGTCAAPPTAPIPPNNPYGPVTFFRLSPTGAVYDQATPYVGVVLAVAWDGSGSTYVVYANHNVLYIGKRLEASGAYATPTRLSLNASLSATIWPAALVATNGRWWVVWAENVAARGYRLFQAHTLFSRQTRTQITARPAGVNDEHPALGLNSGRVTLVWTRITGGRSALQIATSSGGAWTSRPLTAGGTHNDYSSVTVYGGVIYVVWLRDAQNALFASNAGDGTFRSLVLGSDATGDYPPPATAGPTVAVSGTNVFVTWTGGPYSAHVAEREGGVWSNLEPVGDHTLADRIVAQGTKARLLYNNYEVIKQT
jgi:hypothetical protein